MHYESPLFFRVMEYASAADRDVVDMVSGNPDWDPPEGIREGLEEYASLDSDGFQYPASEGLIDLRSEIAKRRNVDVDRIIVTAGAGEANYLGLARALERDAGDEVVLTDPVYPYYPGKTRMLGGTPRFVPAKRNGELDVDGVREVVSDRTACLVVNTPNNPTGAVYGAGTLSSLRGIAEDYDAVLVSDEVYDRFDLDGGFASALSLDSDRCVITGGFSKSMAITGFRVGYAIFPRSLVAGAKTRHMLTNVTGSRPAQFAVLRALESTGPDYYERNRALLRDRIRTFSDALDDIGAKYSRPGGAFYMLVRFDGFPGTMANVRRLIDEAGVGGMPGEAFGSTRSEWFRFALVTPRVGAAATRLVDYFDA